MYFITTKRMLEVCFFQHTPTFIIEPKNRRAWRLRSESETLDTSLQNPFHICDRDPVICHRDLLVGGIP